MMEYDRRPGGDVKKSPGWPRRGLDDRLPPLQENGLKKRAKAMDRTTPPWKEVVRPGSNEKIKGENVKKC